GSTSGAAGTSTTAMTADQIPGIFSGAQCTPTAVRLESFVAKPHGKGVWLSWKTGFEVDNLGFNVYRVENGEPIRINPSLIAGSALRTRPGRPLTAGWSYSWIDRPPSDNGFPQYYLEDIDLHGDKVRHGPIGVDYSLPDPESSVEPSPAMMLREITNSQSEEGRQSGPLQQTAEAPSKAAKARPDLVLQQSTLAGGPAIRISVQNEGWYQITQQQLVAAGMNPSASPSSLQLFVNGSEVPIQVTGSNPYSIGFYGVGLDTQSTNLNVYWLVWGYQTGQRIPVVQDNVVQTAPANFPYTVQLKERTVYFPGALGSAIEDFFGDPVLDDGPTPGSLQVTNLDPSSSAPGTLQVVVQGVTDLPHRVLITFNGTPVGEDDFVGITEGTATISIPHSLILAGANNLSLIAAAGDSDVSLLDHINLTYPHTYSVTGNQLKFTVSANQKVNLTGFTNANVTVMDVTSPNSVSQVSAIVQQTGAGFVASFAAPSQNGGLRTLYAFTADQAMTPVSLAANQPSNWGQPGHGADMVIITNSAFASQVNPLAQLRQSQGLKVSVIDVVSLYNEFNFGIKDPQAIKSFLTYTQSNWRPAPRFVLMAGKATYDTKNYLGYGFFDLVPTKLINTQTMQADSDDWFVDFNNDGLPDLAIGRLPARTPQEMNVMVQKTLEYQHTTPRGGALMACDISDDFDFLGATIQLESMLPAGLTPSLVDRGSNPNAEAALLNGINQGPKLVNYNGHASVDLWRGNFLTDSSASTLTNGQNLPFFVMMTCLSGAFDDPSLDSLSESLLNAPQGGAAFVWASSAITQPASQGIINQALYQLLFAPASKFGGATALTMGQAAAKAKASAGDPDVRRTWIFFGDPSMPLQH
ncbi:MAG TPA: C25 family cysteine peptidase, partial [Blastocatellia bacterium]|nr:C25 family cysteine peptidase [Blastocatellia bacterium]